MQLANSKGCSLGYMSCIVSYPGFKLLCKLFYTSILSAYGADLSSEACRELGFSSNLLCSSCDLLGEFSLTKLQPNCRQCCQQEAQMEARKLYAGAILEVFQGEFYCFDFTYYLYVRGSDPVLKLLDDNGNIAEELSILKWNTDSVEEFLSEKLDRI
uniref:Selenoprotein F n=1 Tax=Amphiprion ocellaris TaxID=80972 RepID=A0A3Q1B7T6_AMPOC